MTEVELLNTVDPPNSMDTTTTTNNNKRVLKKARVEGNSQVVGNYRLTETLVGEGSTGKVMLAYNLISGKEAAVKIVNKSSKWLKEEAFREVSILGKLRHKNIITVDAVEEDDNHVYIFAEYLEERDIYTYMQKNGKFSEQQAYKLFKQMVAAVQSCHENKICHHDIKLENCVINQQLDMKLIDFAYAIEWGSMAGNFLKFNGSPAYSAPEILFRKPHNETVDIFGLGACLYYMICHCFPFCDEDNTSYEELCQNVRLCKVEFPEFVSLEAQDLITKLLAKDKRPTLDEIKSHPWFTMQRTKRALSMSN